MRERALTWSLRSLSVALLVGPLIVAFAVHGWDYRAAVMPSQTEMDEITERFQSLFGEGSVEFQSSTFVGTTITATVEFKLPFNFRVELVDFSCSIFCNTHNVFLASLEMEEEKVTIQPGENVTLTLVGELTSNGSQDISDNHGGALPPLAALSFTGSFQAESYGVTMKMQIGGG